MRHNLNCIFRWACCDCKCSCHMRSISCIIGSFKSNCMDTVSKWNSIYSNLAVFIVCSDLISINKCFDRCGVQSGGIGLLGILRNWHYKFKIIICNCHIIWKDLSIRCSFKSIIDCAKYRSFAICHNRRVVNSDIVNVECYITRIRLMLFVRIFPRSVIYIQLHDIAVKFRFLAVFIDTIGSSAVLQP